MKLPNSHLAEVPRAKLVNYLLSKTHRDGRGKAKFFGHFGFASENWDQLANRLLEHGQNNEVSETIETDHGNLYVVNADWRTPIDRTVNLRTVWFVETGQIIPRLVTAYPI